MATEEDIRKFQEIIAAEGAAPSEEVGNNAEPSPDLNGAVPDTEVEAAPSEPVEVVPFRPELPEESKEFAELARRERAAREIADQNKRLAQELEDLRNSTKSLHDESSLKEEARRDPLGFIKKHGITYEDLTNTILNGEEPTQNLQIRSEVEELRGELDQLKRAKAAEAESLKARNQEAAYNKFIDEINNFVETNPSDCELIKLQGAQQLVGEVIRDNYAATGRTMGYEQACNIVENHLEKQVRSAMRSSRFQSKQSVPEVAPPVVEDKSSARPKTLTNENMASPAHIGDGSNKPTRLSRDESLNKLASMDFWA